MIPRQGQGVLYPLVPPSSPSFPLFSSRNSGTPVVRPSLSLDPDDPIPPTSSLNPPVLYPTSVDKEDLSNRNPNVLLTVRSQWTPRPSIVEWGLRPDPPRLPSSVGTPLPDTDLRPPDVDLSETHPGASEDDTSVSRPEPDRWVHPSPGARPEASPKFLGTEDPTRTVVPSGVSTGTGTGQ